MDRILVSTKACYSSLVSCALACHVSNRPAAAAIKRNLNMSTNIQSEQAIEFLATSIFVYSEAVKYSLSIPIQNLLWPAHGL